MVLYNAMDIKRIKDNKFRYKQEDYRMLDEFYKLRIQQVHIVGEYANLMVRDYDAALQFVQDYFQKQEERLSKQRAEQGKAAREEGEKYLAENAKKDGVVTLPSGLQYQVLREGNGRKPKATDQVKCHYEGMLVDGTLFDSSIQRGEPATFPLNGVIAGWTEGLQLMQEGAKYRFVIPYHLGYGERGAGGSIPPFSALVFDVELIEVV